MGIDLEKMKAKRDALENRGNGKSAFWRPEDGEQTIRIVPTSDGDPFKDEALIELENSVNQQNQIIEANTQ